MTFGFRGSHVADAAQPIIVLWPVHQANIAGICAGGAIPAIGDAAVKPQPAVGAVQLVVRIECVLRGPSPIETLTVQLNNLPGHAGASEGT